MERARSRDCGLDSLPGYRRRYGGPTKTIVKMLKGTPELPFGFDVEVVSTGARAGLAG